MFRAPLLSPHERAWYRAHGYLVVPGLVPERFLEEVQGLLERLVDEKVAAWRRASLLDESHADRDFASRYHRAWLDAGRPPDADGSRDQRFFDGAQAVHLRPAWLLHLAAQILDAETVVPLQSCFPRARFPDDDTTRLPWHQDVQCLRPIVGDDFVTAWIPLARSSDARPCLDVSPVDEHQAMFPPVWSERSGYVRMRDDDAQALTDVTSIVMGRGDLLLMSPYLPHRSQDNGSSEIRWSVDLRYSAPSPVAAGPSRHERNPEPDRPTEPPGGPSCLPPVHDRGSL